MQMALPFQTQRALPFQTRTQPSSSLGGETPCSSLGGETHPLAPPHPRDALIEFDAGPHKYTCAGEADYMSVTTWNHSHFKAFDADTIITKMMSNKTTWPKSPYYGQTREDIKAGWEKNRDEAAQAGTEMHYAIECYYRGVASAPHALTPRSGAGGAEGVSTEGETSPEWGGGACGVEACPPQFVSFVAANPTLKPYRTEWMIFDEDVRLAGSIDMVYENETDGTLMIYDWKRCKEITKFSNFKDAAYAVTECISHLPDTNFWHYALQLNTYKTILEAKYDKKVSLMCLVVLHPNFPTYQVHTVPDLAEEMTALMALRKAQLMALRKSHLKNHLQKPLAS